MRGEFLRPTGATAQKDNFGGRTGKGDLKKEESEILQVDESFT